MERIEKNESIDTLTSADSTNLGEESREPFSVLNDAIYPTRAIHNIDFCDMVDGPKGNYLELLQVKLP